MKLKNRVEIARKLAGDVVFMFQSFNNVKDVESLPFPEDKKTNYSSVARRVKDGRIGAGHPGKDEFRDISWEDLVSKLKTDYPIVDFKPALLDMCVFIKTSVKTQTNLYLSRRGIKTLSNLPHKLPTSDTFSFSSIHFIIFFSYSRREFNRMIVKGLLLFVGKKAFFRHSIFYGQSKFVSFCIHPIHQRQYH